MAARGRRRGRGRGRNVAMDPPNPPVVTMEQLMGMQAQLMQTMMQRMDNEPIGGPPPVHVRNKHGEFIKGHPPVFTHSTDPLDADDWLRTVEKQLDIAQCNDMERCCMHRATAGGSSRLVGFLQVWMPCKCRSYYLGRVYSEFQDLSYP
jgi:hypothetical protein